MTDWIISTDPARLQLATVHGWLTAAYWSTGIRRDVVERAFANSLVAGAYRGEVQIGVARAVTDQATFAWLCDVFVDPAARGQGIASALVTALIEDPRVRTLRHWGLGTRDAHAVYTPFGFVPADPKIWMRYLRDPAHWT